MSRFLTCEARNSKDDTMIDPFVNSCFLTNQLMSLEEEHYIYERQRLTQLSIYKFLKRLEIPEFDVDKFVLSSLKPLSLGIAISGGGYRSFLNGAGLLMAFDDRSYNSTLPGHLGGLLQSTSYISAISGGSWILMSTILGDYSPMEKIRNEWLMSEPLLEGIPNFKQVEVNRKDVQMLPVSFKDDDGDFYEKLHRIGKRDLIEEQQDYNITEDSDDQFDIFETFYQNLELLRQLEEDDEFDNKKIVKREKKLSTDVWFEGFKTFFREMFNKKEEPRVSATSVLPNIELTSDLSLKNLKKTFNFYKNLHLEVRAKKSAGFPVSFTDYWGRALSRKIFPKNARGPDKTFSSVQTLPSFKKFYQPLPIIVSNLREPGVGKTSVDSDVFEFTPFEFGSWDLKVFMNLKYLGSLLCGGNPVFHITKKVICFTNFDNAGFITGTSSSLFNNVLIYVWQLAANSTKDKYRAIKAVLNTFGLTSQQNGIDPKKHPDYALYTPNPFYKFGGENKSAIFNNKHLYMVDGGEDGQNIPLQPLLQKSRQVDLIFALDSTSDINGWPNGSILQNTFTRYNHINHVGTTITIDGIPTTINLFPEIPSPKRFVAKKLNTKPTFFGCYLSKFPKKSLNLNEGLINEYLPPIIGYFANTNHTYNSNISTFQLTYTDDEISGVVENAYNIMTYSNSSLDPDYYKCIGCIMIKREYDRKSRGLGLINDMETPSFCGKCYKKYCYN